MSDRVPPKGPYRTGTSDAGIGANIILDADGNRIGWAVRYAVGAGEIPQERAEAVAALFAASWEMADVLVHRLDDSSSDEMLRMQGRAKRLLDPRPRTAEDVLRDVVVALGSPEPAGARVRLLLAEAKEILR